MENATEALKMAAAMLLFLVALTVSIASFSKINVTVRNIIKIKDREQDYYYVSNSKDSNNIVGSEIIIPTMYRAYFENIEVHFKDSHDNDFPLYSKLDNSGHDIGIVSTIDLSSENFANKDEAIKHLDYILSGDGQNVWGVEWNTKYKAKYEKERIYIEGFYNKIKDKKFIQTFEEKYIGEGTSKIKKIIITYKEK